MEMNLQYFADEEQAQTESQETEKVSLTKAELDKKLQAYADSEYDRRSAKKQAEFDEKLQQSIEEAKSEGQKLAKMSAKEKEDAESKKRLDALNQREAELNRRELQSNVSDMLADKGLPKELAGSFVQLGDADKISQVVDAVQKQIEQEVNEQVKARMRQNAPQNASSTLDGTDDPFTKLINSYK